MSDKRRYRCAIYTRKSHEEGLDQDFNSLDAQREACEAYVLSQAGLGWVMIDRAYDDGGISGGHLERGGLQELLQDIERGQVDVVVVYKVDRLTRSITDFGRLVEVFDAHDVSFVSVTQAFNTTSSMGRLTLNVLLSFAQFEREVTAERIRDKIASSKQKGMWMGGPVPYGYRNEDRQLIIDAEEAETVRLMFEAYLQHQDIGKVKDVLDRRGGLTRIRTSRSGRRTGGIAFSAGNIADILGNPVYAGMIRHRQQVYPGNHEAIIPGEQARLVQKMLAGNRKHRKSLVSCTSPALLGGLLFDQAGNRLVCHYASKKGKRYYYYVSRPEEGDRVHNGMRLPMAMIEGTVIRILDNTFSDGARLLDCVNLESIPADQTALLIANGQTLAHEIRQYAHDQRRVFLHEVVDRIEVATDRITIILAAEMLSSKLKACFPEGHVIRITEPVTFRKRGQEMKLVVGALEPLPDNRDQTLINLVAKAYLLKTELEAQTTGSIKAFADKYNIDHADAKNLVPLSYLAPEIVEDILSGRQPAELNTRRLKSVARHLPLSWAGQRQVLGFTS